MRRRDSRRHTRRGKPLFARGGASDAEATISNQSLEFGALTFTSAGGAKALDDQGNEVDFVSVDSVVSGDGTGWTVVGDRLLRNTATPASSAGAVLRCTTDLGVIDVTISATASVYLAASLDEMLAVTGAGAGSISDTELRLRYFADRSVYDLRLATPTAGNGAVNGHFDNLTGPFVITSDRATEPSFYAKLPQFAVFTTTGGASPGRVRIRNVAWDRETSPSVAANILEIGSAGDPIVDDVILEDCTCTGNYPRARDPDGVDQPAVTQMVRAINTTNVTIRNNTTRRLMHNINVVDSSGFNITNNTAEEIWADQIRCGYPVSNGTILGNKAYAFVGDNGLHPDGGVQFEGPTDQPCTNITMTGNLMWYGTEGHRTPPLPAGFVTQPLRTASFTPTLLTVSPTLERIDSRAGNVVATLPVLAGETDGARVCLQLRLGDAGGLVLQTQGGDTMFDFRESQSLTSLSFTSTPMTVTVEVDQTNVRYQIQVEAGDAQFQFANPAPSAGTGCVIRLNACLTTSNHSGSFAGATWSNNDIDNNSYLQAVPGNVAGGNSLPNTRVQNYNQYTAIGGINIGGTNNRARANFCSSVTLGSGGTDEDNVVAVYFNDIPALEADFQGADNGVFRPETLAQMIAGIRPELGSEGDRTGVGCGLAALPADDYWDFVNNTFATNPSPPWFVRGYSISAAPGGATASWRAPILDGDSAVTGYSVEVSVNGGGFSAAPGYDGTSTTYTDNSRTSGDTVAFRVAPINANGTGPFGVETSVVATSAVPGAFTAPDWSVADAASGGQLDVTINTLPAANGAAITDIDYRIDAGSWVSSGGTGNFSITGLTDGVQVSVELRAVNSVGDGPAGDLKSATPTSGSVAPTVVAASYADITDNTTLSATAGSGSNRIQLFNVVMRKNAVGTSTTVTGITFGGTAATNVTEQWVGTFDGTTLWAMLETDIPVGAQNIVVTFTGDPLTGTPDDHFTVSTITVQDANQVIPSGAAIDNDLGTNVAAVANMTAVSADALLMAAAGAQNTLSVVGGQTREGLETFGSPNGSSAIYSKVGSAGAVSIETSGNAGRNFIAACVIEPV